MSQTIRSEPFHAWLIRNVPDAPAPLGSFAQHPEAFQCWWKMLRAVFHIPTPNAFPRARFTGEEIELLDQFVNTAQDLASMTVLSFEGGITFRQDGTVERRLPPRDSVRGALVTLRQLESPDEDASFAKVWKLVNRRLHETDPEAARRHRRYRLIQNRLSNEWLVKMADVEACIRQGFDTKLAMSLHHSGAPRDVLNEAMYTGHVHWNRQRASTGALGQSRDEVRAGMFEMDMFHAVAQLSHWKFVYAEVLKLQLGT